jgi:hypothetical protein
MEKCIYKELAWDCNKSACKYFQYCIDHKCAFEGCQNRIDNSTYCNYHKLLFSKYNAENVGFNVSEYNTCKYSSCDVLIHVSQKKKYCDIHECKIEKCGESIFKRVETYLDSGYYTPVEKEKIYIFSYCKKHKCVISKCKNPRTDLNLCEQHKLDQ